MPEPLKKEYSFEKPMVPDPQKPLYDTTRAIPIDLNYLKKQMEPMVPDPQKPLYDTSKAIPINLKHPAIVKALDDIVKAVARRTIIDEMKYAKAMIELHDILLD